MSETRIYGITVRGKVGNTKWAGGPGAQSHALRSSYEDGPTKRTKENLQGAKKRYPDCKTGGLMFMWMNGLDVEPVFVNINLISMLVYYDPS